MISSWLVTLGKGKIAYGDKNLDINPVSYSFSRFFESSEAESKKTTVYFFLFDTFISISKFLNYSNLYFVSQCYTNNCKLKLYFQNICIIIFHLLLNFPYLNLRKLVIKFYLCVLLNLIDHRVLSDQISCHYSQNQGFLPNTIYNQINIVLFISYQL